MQGKKSLRFGTLGAVVASLVCFTPLVAVALGALGLAAWFPQIDYAFHVVLVVSIGLAGYGLYQYRRNKSDAPVTTTGEP